MCERERERERESAQAGRIRIRVLPFDPRSRNIAAVRGVKEDGRIEGEGIESGQGAAGGNESAQLPELDVTAFRLTMRARHNA